MKRAREDEERRMRKHAYKSRMMKDKGRREEEEARRKTKAREEDKRLH